MSWFATIQNFEKVSKKKKKQGNHMPIAALDGNREKQTEWQLSIIL